MMKKKRRIKKANEKRRERRKIQLDKKWERKFYLNRLNEIL